MQLAVVSRLCGFRASFQSAAAHFRRSRFGRALALVLGLDLSGCGHAVDPEVLARLRRGTEHVDVAWPVAVPLVGDRDLPLVQVEINGRGPYRMLVDVGGNVVSLRASVAREIGAVVVQRLSSREVIRLDSLRVGSALFRDLYAVGEPTLDVDGVIGFNVFRTGVLTLDYPRQRLEWTRGELPEADGGRVLSYELRERMPFVPVALDTVSLVCNLDTGARGTLILASSFEARLPLVDSATTGPVLWNQAEGKMPTRRAVLRGDLRLGELVVEMPSLLFNPVAEDDCLIGSGLLQPFVLSFDLAANRVRLSRPMR